MEIISRSFRLNLQYIYVPRYDPSVIYIRGWSPGGMPFMTFGLRSGNRGLVEHGLLTGVTTSNLSWLEPSGWVNHSRPYVRIHERLCQQKQTLQLIRPGGMMHHVATPRSIGHRALLVPAPVSAGRHARLKSGGGLPYRPNLRSGCSAPRAIPILSAIAASKPWYGSSSSDGYRTQDFTKRPILPAPDISKGPSQTRHCPRKSAASSLSPQGTTQSADFFASETSAISEPQTRRV